MNPSSTRLCGPLDSPHVDGENLLWSASLAVAWRELAALLGGGLVAAEGSSAAVSAWLEGMARDAVAAASLQDPAIVARAGSGRAFLEELSAALAEAGLEAGAALSQVDRWAGGFHAYAQFDKAVRFAVPFEKEERPWYSCGSWVESFGLERRQQSEEVWQAQREQLVVHYPCYDDEEAETLEGEELYRAMNDFLVELVLDGREDRLFVASLRRGATLRETVAKARSMMTEGAHRHPRGHLAAGERFRMPIVDLDLLVEHAIVAGARVSARSDEPLALLGEVIQHLAFRLDEGGATVRSSARSSGLSLPPRALDCVRPFLIFWLSGASELPLAALWIENGEVMRRMPTPDFVR